MAYLTRLIIYTRWSIIYIVGSSIFGHTLNMDMMMETHHTTTKDTYCNQLGSNQNYIYCLLLQDSTITIYGYNTSGKTYTHLYPVNIFSIDYNSNDNSDWTVSINKNLCSHAPPFQKYLSYHNLIGKTILTLYG